MDEVSFNELKDAHWLFDTPGIMKDRDVGPSTKDIFAKLTGYQL